MNGRMIGTLLRKDLKLYFKDRFIALVTALGLVFYAIIYFVMPATVSERLELALYAPGLPPDLAEALEEDGADTVSYETEEALKAAIAAGDYPVGVALPADLVLRLRSGQKGEIRVYFNADFPADLEEAYALLMEEVGYVLAGQELNLEVREEVLGVDRAGAQIPSRDRMRPLFAVFLLMVETMGLASLITSEIVTGTIRALLVTPLTVGGLFLSKGILGVGMAFAQVVLLLAVTGGLRYQPGLMLVTLFLGAMLVTGLAFLVASVARDMLSVIDWNILVIFLLVVSAVGVLAPGIFTNWVKVLPSYYLVDTVHQVANLGSGWSQVSNNLLILLLITLALSGLGVLALQRRFQQ